MVEISVFEIVGVSPLLMNNPTVMLVPPPVPPPKKGGAPPSAKKKEYVPEEEAEARTYRMPDGQLFVPSMWFRAALLKGCVGRKFEKSKVGAATLVQASVFTPEVKCPLVDPATGKPLKTYEINSVRVVVGKAGVIRCRPEMDPWGCELPLEIDDDFVTREQVLGLLNIAGKVAGVGDWRPNRKGSYGRFRAELQGG